MNRRSEGQTIESVCVCPNSLVTLCLEIDQHWRNGARGSWQDSIAKSLPPTRVLGERLSSAPQQSTICCLSVVEDLSNRKMKPSPGRPQWIHRTRTSSLRTTNRGLIANREWPFAELGTCADFRRPRRVDWIWSHLLGTPEGAATTSSSREIRLDQVKWSGRKEEGELQRPTKPRWSSTKRRPHTGADHFDLPGVCGRSVETIGVASAAAPLPT